MAVRNKMKCQKLGLKKGDMSERWPTYNDKKFKTWWKTIGFYRVYNPIW